MLCAFQREVTKRLVCTQVQGGGNVGNALTAAARLGLQPRIISKVADDSLGAQILAELEGDGVDTRHMVVAQGGVSPFTYIIVDRSGHTRTCIHTPGQPPMQPHELTQETVRRIQAPCPHGSMSHPAFEETAIRKRMKVRCSAKGQMMQRCPSFDSASGKVIFGPYLPKAPDEGNSRSINVQGERGSVSIGLR